MVLVSSFFSAELVAEAQGLVPEWGLGLVLELDLVEGLAVVVHQSGRHLRSMWIMRIDVPSHTHVPT